MASHDLMMNSEYVSGLDGNGMYELVLSATKNIRKAEQARMVRDSAVAARQVQK